jgi:thiamine-phosphate pyrophosphorylase
VQVLRGRAVLSAGVALLRYYITDRRANGWSTTTLLYHIARYVDRGVDYIQIREKDLTARELFELTKRAVEIATGSGTRILVNDRTDIAIGAGAAGVHLRGDSIQPELLRATFGQSMLIGVSCHSIDDVVANQAADFLVFGPVFDSPGKGSPQGLGMLARAVAASRIPVFALGGVNANNVQACLDAGASGVAAIRLFQE